MFLKITTETVIDDSTVSLCAFANKIFTSCSESGVMKLLLLLYYYYINVYIVPYAELQRCYFEYNIL